MPDSETEDPGQAIKPFRNRVRVLAEVVSDADELALVSEVCRARGWPVRPPQDGEVREYPEQGRTWLVIEVRFPGSTRSAVTEAVKRVEHVADQFQLGLWVRFAQVIDYPRERRNPYFVDHARPKWQGVFRTAGTTAMLLLGRSAGEEAVRERLALINLGEPFDPERQSVRAALSWSILDDSPGDQADSARRLLLVVAGGAAVAVCGFAAGFADGAWRAIPVLAGLVVSALLVWFLSRDQSPRDRLLRAVPFAIVLTGGAFGASLTPHHDPRILLATCVGLGIAFLVWRGMLLALRDSWLTKQASWVIPLVLTALAPLALSLGGLYDEQYLDRTFGIPSDSISIPAIYRIAIAGRSSLIGLGFTAIFVAVIGYSRYFHQLSGDSRWMPLLYSSLTLAVYLLASLAIGLNAVADAGGEAAAAATAGRQPSGYFGIQGVLACVRPVTNDIPVYNAPLPAGRPVLSFGTSGDWLWLWDPETGRAIEVPLDDVTVTPATGTPARCG
jgi:hypothetical protein